MSELKVKEDQRNTARSLYRSFAKVIFEAVGQLSANTVDLSTEGMGLVCAYNAKSKTECWIKLKLPVNGTYQPFEVKGRVNSSIFSGDFNGFRLGLEFINAPEPFKKAVQEALKKSK